VPLVSAAAPWIDHAPSGILISRTKGAPGQEPATGPPPRRTPPGWAPTPTALRRARHPHPPPSPTSARGGATQILKDPLLGATRGHSAAPSRQHPPQPRPDRAPSVDLGRALLRAPGAAAAPQGIGSGLVDVRVVGDPVGHDCLFERSGIRPGGLPGAGQAQVGLAQVDPRSRIKPLVTTCSAPHAEQCTSTR
jgi:hypothetical protein